MAWTDVTASSFVTNNNAQNAVSTGVFTLKSGQSISANDNFINIDEANLKLNINTISGTGTDFPVKSLFVAIAAPLGDILVKLVDLGTGYHEIRSSEAIPINITVRILYQGWDEFGYYQSHGDFTILANQTVGNGQPYSQSNEYGEATVGIEYVSPTTYNGRNIVVGDF